jgi:serine protease Do
MDDSFAMAHNTFAVSVARLLPLLAGLALSICPAAHAQTTAQAPPAASTEDVNFAKRLSRVFRSVSESAEPAVVHITRLSERVFRRNFFDAGVRRVVPDGVGSGVIIDAAKGIIVTNNHVIDSAMQLSVKLSDGREIPASVVGKDAATDLAVLQLQPENGATVESLALRAVRFADSDAIEVGEWVVAIGSPFGLDNSVTQGIISAKGRTVAPRETGIAYSDYIQTDAAINPGNSGGPLLSLDGQIVGINSAIASRAGGYDGIGFSIPSNTVKAVVENILQNGRVVRGFLGVGLSDTAGGVLVGAVTDDSPATEAGLREGDIITKFNGNAVNEARLRTSLAITAPGTQITLEVQRDGKPLTINATLADRDRAVTAQFEREGQVYVPALQIGVVDLSRERAKQANMRLVQGAEVVSFEDKSVAQGKLQQGDLIIEVNDERVRDAESLREMLAQAGKGALRLGVVRFGENGFVDSGYVTINSQR